MATIKISNILKQQPESFNGLTKVWFMQEGDNKPMYLFCKPGNEPEAGQELEGDLSIDKQGFTKFKKTSAPWTPGQPAQAAPQVARTQEKVFKADPAKLSQEFSLEVAKNQSIQRQVAVKGVVDLMVAGKIETDDLDKWFDLLMDKLANHWAKHEQPDDVELPPVEAYDESSINVEDLPL